MLKFNGVELTQATIEATKAYWVNHHLRCIEDVRSGEVKVNYPEKYFKHELERIDFYTTEFDASKVSLTFLQRAYYIQTGESVGLLGNY